MDITKERIQKILDAGANLIMTTKGIDDLALKYFVESGVMAYRRVPKDDLRRIAKGCGATLLSTLWEVSHEEGSEEEFSPEWLGTAGSVEEVMLGDYEFTYIRNLPTTKVQTIVLRGASDYMTEEVERSVHDAICAVKRVIEEPKLVAGGGAVETALAVYLEDFARTLGSREQLAISEFAEALLCIPKTLAMNAAKDAIDLLAKLRAAHFTS